MVIHDTLRRLFCFTREETTIRLTENLVIPSIITIFAGADVKWIAET